MNKSMNMECSLTVRPGQQRSAYCTSQDSISIGSCRFQIHLRILAWIISREVTREAVDACNLRNFHSKIFNLTKYREVLIKYRKIPKISPGAYIKFFQRPFLRGLFLEGLIFRGAYLRMEICVSKSIVMVSQANFIQEIWWPIQES